ncbi:unnamed protein product [Paramecium pentaurelia]|uniref:RING-type domain-containing protein n=1 Tax=Paramecium pentaurelia TaxID=43138 RepID=A0A8S1SY10_9CILI|nr:unnamed protein product [Paramecium pentaurelia]
MGSQPAKSRNLYKYEYQQNQMEIQQPNEQIKVSFFKKSNSNHSLKQKDNQSSETSKFNTNKQQFIQILQNDFCIENAKLIGNQDLQIEFIIFAQTPCKIQLFVQGQEICDTFGDVLQSIQAKEFQEEIQLIEPQTKNVKLISKLKFPKSCIIQKNSNPDLIYWKIIILIQNQKMMMIYYYDYEDDQLKLIRQKLQLHQQVVFEIQEIIGINDTNLIESQKNEQVNGKCISCKSISSDTIIMPCRHMNLCQNCANQIIEINNQHQLQVNKQHALDLSVCPQCSMEIDFFIKLQKA